MCTKICVKKIKAAYDFSKGVFFFPCEPRLPWLRKEMSIWCTGGTGGRMGRQWTWRATAVRWAKLRLSTISPVRYCHAKLWRLRGSGVGMEGGLPANRLNFCRLPVNPQKFSLFVGSRTTRQHPKSGETVIGEGGNGENEGRWRVWEERSSRGR